jgi:predicted N-acetyltransferase YhbS
VEGVRNVAEKLSGKLIFRTVSEGQEMQYAWAFLADVHNRMPERRRGALLFERRTSHLEGSHASLRVALLEKNICAAVRIRHATFRLGDARLSVAHISDLCCRPDFRRRGIPAHLIQDTLASLAHERFALAVLHGIRDFAPRFGFVPLYTESAYTLPVPDSFRAEADSFRIRALLPSDIPCLVRMRAMSDANLDGTFVRCSYTFTERWNAIGKGRVLLDKDGSRVGYYFYHSEGGNWWIHELGAITPLLEEQVINTALQDAYAAGIRHVSFSLPPQQPAASYLETLGAGHTTSPHRGISISARVLDVETAMAQCVPEWERLIEKTGTTHKNTAVTFHVSGTSYTLRFAENRVEVLPSAVREKVSLSMDEFTALLLGGMSAEEFLERKHLFLRSESRRALLQIFPSRTLFTWHLDL